MVNILMPGQPGIERLQRVDGKVPSISMFSKQNINTGPNIFFLKTFLKFPYCLTPRITFLFHCSRIFQNGRKLEKTFFVKSVHKGCNDDGDDYGDKDDNDCDNDDCDDGDGYD